MVSVILKKELRGYFNSPIAYIILAVFLGVSGWFFTQELLLGGRADINGFINIVPLLYFLLIPGLCMKLVAEERSLGTIEVLSTLPLKDTEIIFGKWLASFMLLFFGLIATLIYPITVAFLGNLDWGMVTASYVGFVLLSLFFMSIGIFASSITSSQIIALIVGIFISFFFFIIGKLLTFFPSSIVSFFNYVGIDYHLNNITRGVLDSRNIIYFLSFTGLFLFGAIYFTGKFKDQLINTVYTILTLIIIILINIISQKLFVRFDITEGNIYSLSRASVTIAQQVPDYVIIKAYITSNLPFPYNNRARYVHDLLAEYQQKSKGKVKFETLDPRGNKEVMEAQRNGVMPLQFTEVKQGEFGVKQGFMGLLFLYEDKREVIPVIDDLANLEYDISSRIKKLSQREQKTIGFTTGHDEIELDERIKSIITERYQVEDINLGDTVPILCNGLVVLGPKKDFEKEETARIKQYIENQGAVAFFLDRYNINLDFFMAFPLELPRFDTLLNEYRIKISQGLIMDKNNEVLVLSTQRGFFAMQNYIPYPYFPKITALSKEHPITRDFEAVVLPYVSPVTGGEELAKTSKNSWLRQKPQSLNPLDKEKFMEFALPFEEKGPFSTMNCISGDHRLFFVGTARFMDSRFISGAGITLFMNILDWLTQDEVLISIRSKVITDRPIKNLTPGTKIFIRWLNVLLPCAMFIAFGIIRWRIRKGQKFI